MLPELSPSFAATREALRALACYAVSPARKARTGRIGLRAHEGGIATPPFDDGARIVVHGDQLRSATGEVAPITTVADAARLLGVDLSPDPGVGHDLPPYTPDADLAVDREASLQLGAWYGFAQGCLDRLGEILPGPGADVSEAQLWPEHFDLAVTATLPTEAKVNVGFSPGDTFSDDPYVYVGPYDTAGLDRTDAYWNAPFGAFLGYGETTSSPDPEATALAFIRDGFGRLSPG